MADVGQFMSADVLGFSDPGGTQKLPTHRASQHVVQEDGQTSTRRSMGQTTLN